MGSSKACVLIFSYDMTLAILVMACGGFNKFMRSQLLLLVNGSPITDIHKW